MPEALCSFLTENLLVKLRIAGGNRPTLAPPESVRQMTNQA